MRAALQPKTLSSAALYAACTSSGCSRPSASIFTPEFTSRICQAPPTRTTSIDPKRMPMRCAARSQADAGATDLSLAQQDRLRAQNRDCGASPGRGVGPRAGSRRDRCRPSMPSQRGRSLPGRCRSGRKLAQRTLAVARDRRPLLAVDDERTIIEQHHAYLVLDLDIGRNREARVRRKVSATARSSAGGVFTRKTRFAGRSLIRLDYDPSGCAFSRPSIASRDPDPGTCSLQFRFQKQRVGDAGHAGKLQNFGGRRFVIGDLVRGGAVQPDVIAEGEVGACDPRCMTISQPPDLTSIEME